MRQMKQAKPRLAYDYLDKRINIVFNARRLMDLIAKTDDIAKRWAKKADRLWQNRKPSRVG